MPNAKDLTTLNEVMKPWKPFVLGSKPLQYPRHFMASPIPTSHWSCPSTNHNPWEESIKSIMEEKMTKLTVVGALKRHKETKHSWEEIAPTNISIVSKNPHEPWIPLAVKDNDQSRYSEVHANLSPSSLCLCGVKYVGCAGMDVLLISLIFQFCIGNSCTIFNLWWRL